MAQGNDLKFQNRPATESASKDGNDRTHEREHAGDTTAADAKTLDCSPLSEFSAAQPLALAMPKPAAAICWKVAPLIHRDSAFCSFSRAWTCAGRDERSPPPRFDYPIVLTALAIHRPS